MSPWDALSASIWTSAGVIWVFAARTYLANFHQRQTQVMREWLARVDTAREANAAMPADWTQRMWQEHQDAFPPRSRLTLAAQCIAAGVCIGTGLSQFADLFA